MVDFTPDIKAESPMPDHSSTLTAGLGVMQRTLVALQRQRVVAFLIYDLLRDGTLAVERVGGHDGALQRQQFQQLRHRSDLVGLGVGGYLRQHQALLAAPGTDPMQGRLAAGPIKRAAQDLPIDGHYALALLAKLRHEPLKRVAELIRVQIAKQPAERVVAGQAILQLEKAAQKRLFGLREHRHVHRTLAATQHRAQSDQQQFIEIVQTGIAAARVFQTLPTGGKLLQGIF